LGIDTTKSQGGFLVNVFNRLIVILLLMLLIVITATVAIVPQPSLWFTSQTLAWLHQEAGNYINSGDRLLFAGARVLVGGAIIFVCLIGLWLELRRPRKKTIRVQKLAGGDAHITVDSIEQRLAYNIDQLPDVVNVNSHITGRTRGVDIDLMLETSPDIDVPMKTEEVLELTREVVGERMGLKLGKVQINLKHAPYPKQ
jgi:hypothetical protein